MFFEANELPEYYFAEVFIRLVSRLESWTLFATIFRTLQRLINLRSPNHEIISYYIQSIHNLPWQLVMRYLVF